MKFLSSLFYPGTYTHHVARGFGWQSVLKLAANVLALLKIMAIARLLGPFEAGQFSLVMIALGLMESLTQTGVNTTILQSKHSVEYFLNTAWVIAIIRGFCISCLMIGIGFGMAHFYQQQQLLFLVALASLIPMIKGFINPMIVVMHKQLDFFADTAYRLSLLVVDVLAVVTLIWMFNSVFAWISGLIVTALFEVCISFLFFTAKPRFEYSSSRATAIFAQAKGFALSGFLSYLSENIDNLIIGKLFGSTGLGVYQQSYGLSHELNSEAAKSVYHSSLPIYTRIAHDKPRLKTAFFKTAYVTFVLMIGLSLPIMLFPQQVVMLIFGEKWLAAIPLLPWLALAGIIQGCLTLLHTIMIAQKKLTAINWQLGSTFLLQVSGIIWLGTIYGMTGALTAICLARAIPLPFLAWSAYQQLTS